MKDYIITALSEIKNGYSVCGVIDKRKRIYPLNSDTKVISAVFEMVTSPVIYAYAEKAGMVVKEPEEQNYYPDFTLMKDTGDVNKVAIDIKTTYQSGDDTKFSYTLGSYTSYIRETRETKNILYPYSDYKEHWIIGFVYRRALSGGAYEPKIYSVDELDKIEVPFAGVDVFMQEKWKIAGDKAGSGNTTNIGSVNAKLEDFVDGSGVFKSENEFLEYWRGYGRTAAERNKSYSNIDEFRKAHS